MFEARRLGKQGYSQQIEFDQDTFDNTHPSTIYYGTSPNNAPLPSWITFDPAALSLIECQDMGTDREFKSHVGRTVSSYI
jgi:hypothetical protein